MTPKGSFWLGLLLIALLRLPNAAAQIGTRSYDCENIPNCRDGLRAGTDLNNKGEHQPALKALKEAVAACEIKSGAAGMCKDPRLTFEFARASQYTLGCSAALPYYEATEQNLGVLPMLLRQDLEEKLANQLAIPECQNALGKSKPRHSAPHKRPEVTQPDKTAIPVPPASAEVTAPVSVSAPAPVAAPSKEPVAVEPPVTPPAPINTTVHNHVHVCNFNDVRIDGNDGVINMCGNVTGVELKSRFRTLKIVGGILGSAVFLAICGGVAAGIYYHYNPPVPAGTPDLPWWQSTGRGLHVSF